MLEIDQKKDSTRAGEPGIGLLSIEADWHKYINSKFGYELSYPNNLTPNDQGKYSDQVVSLVAFTVPNENVLNRPNSKRVTSDVFVIKVTHDSFESILAEKGEKIERLTVAGQEAGIIKETNNLGGDVVVIYISGPTNELIHLIVYPGFFDTDSKQVLDKLINGFHFT